MIAMNSSPVKSTLTSQPLTTILGQDVAVGCKPEQVTANPYRTVVTPLALLWVLAMPTTAMALSIPPISFLQLPRLQRPTIVHRRSVQLSQASCPTSSQTQKRRVALLWTAETTLTLLNCRGQASVHYNSLFQNRRYKGGPIAITGNGRWKLGKAPPVDVTISNFTRTNASVGFHIKVDVLQAGAHTIFDGYLGG